jgi:PAS domain S-box-containing protein
LGDDIDLNEIFADYFINEFEDPLNAYTSSMANYSGAAAAVALAQKQQQVEAQLALSQAPAALPTGGIKTAFHTGQPAAAPPQKKVKQEEVPVQSNATTAPVAKSGLSDRLGFSMPGARVQQQQQQQQQQQFQGMSMMTQPQVVPSKSAPAPAMGGLPVGVGIRLGGVGGVAPSTAQLAPAARPMHPGQFMMWGGMAAGGAGMSEQAIAERRQRNREHAKRSRVRKKFMLESLQEQVKQLQKENVELRMIVQQKIPRHAQQIIMECCSTNPLFSDPNDTAGAENGEKKTEKAETSLVKSDFSLMESLTSGQQNFVLSDPRLPDNPIVYASPGFYALTGYTQDQVLGRNCRFLQGPATDPRAVDIIRQAIASGSDATTCLLNYKADGTPFWNQFFIAALRDSDNCIVNYVSVVVVFVRLLLLSVPAVADALVLFLFCRSECNVRSMLMLVHHYWRTRLILSYLCRIKKGKKTGTTRNESKCFSVVFKMCVIMGENVLCRNKT